MSANPVPVPAASQVEVREMIKSSNMMNETENVVNTIDECVKNVDECGKNVKNVTKTKLSLPSPEISSDEVKTSNDDTPSFSACRKSNIGSRPKIKVKFRVHSSSEGKFQLASANEGPAPKKTSWKNLEKSPSIQTALTMFENLENSGHQYNSKNENLKGTPNKRKKGFDGVGARTLMCIFDEETANNLTRRGNASESPAKKQKCGSQGSNEFNK